MGQQGDSGHTNRGFYGKLIDKAVAGLLGPEKNANAFYGTCETCRRLSAVDGTCDEDGEEKNPEGSCTFKVPKWVSAEV
jgi:hypothetical protein